MSTDFPHKVYLSTIYCGPENVFSVVLRKNEPDLCYSSLNPPVIKCGTLEAIISSLFHDDHENTTKYQKILMLTWRDFVKPKELMKELEKQYFFSELYFEKIFFLNLYFRYVLLSQLADMQQSMSLQNLPKLRKSKISKFFHKWVSTKDYFCWNDEEMFLLMGDFLNRNLPSKYKTLQETVSHEREVVDFPEMSYSQLNDIFSFSAENVAKALNEISYQFMSSITLFLFFREKEKHSVVKTWTAHYNNVFPFSLYFSALIVLFYFIYLFFIYYSSILLFSLLFFLPKTKIKGKIESIFGAKF